MDFDKGITFNSNGNDLSFAIVKREQPGVGVSLYSSSSTTGKINIAIFDIPCDPKNKDIPGKKVEVTLNNTRYTGCGKYLYDARIYDHWILERIKNKLQEPSSYSRGLPFLELGTQGKMTGSDGCNRINGSFELRGSRIAFSPFISTKMACNNNPAEKIFSDLISNQLVDYFIKNDKLVLYLGDDSQLTFSRKL